MDFNTIAASLESTRLASAISMSELAFPAIEVIHVLAIATVYGSILMMDLRLIGIGGRNRTVLDLSSEVLAWTWGAFGVAVISGSLMFVSNATQYVDNAPFLWKMGLLALAGVNMAVFHLTTFRTAAVWGREAMAPPVPARVAGALSIGLWTVIIFLGRWIGFVDFQPF